MNEKIKEKEYTWPVVSDDPLEKGLRILARIILKQIMSKRAEERDAIEHKMKVNSIMIFDHLCFNEIRALPADTFLRSISIK